MSRVLRMHLLICDIPCVQMSACSSQCDTMEGGFTGIDFDSVESENMHDVIVSTYNDINFAWSMPDQCNSNDMRKCRPKYKMDAEVCLSSKPHKDLFTEVDIDLNCDNSMDPCAFVEDDDPCKRCIEVTTPIATSTPCCPRPNSTNQMSRCLGSSEEDIRKTVMTLKKNMCDITRLMCSQMNTTNMEAKLLKEIQDMKCQLSELSDTLRCQSLLCSTSQDPCASTVDDSRLELSKDIEEIKCHLQQLTARLDCCSPPPLCSKCGGPTDNEEIEESRLESECTVRENQRAEQNSECLNQFVLDKVEELKSSIQDVMASEPACSMIEKVDETCDLDVDVPEGSSIDRIFQIIDDLLNIISTDENFINQDRARELICNLKNLLLDEFNRSPDKVDEECTLREMSEKYNSSLICPVPPPPCTTDERRHTNSSVHKGSPGSICGTTTSYTQESTQEMALRGSVNDQVKGVLSELYCILQSFDDDIKMKVISMVEELSLLLDLLQCDAKQSEMSVCANICSEREIDLEPVGLEDVEMDDICDGEQPITVMSEDVDGILNDDGQTSIMATPNLLNLVSQLQNVINSVRPDKQFSECDFSSTLSCVLDALRGSFQTESIDLNSMENVGRILKCLEVELSQQGAADSIQMSSIREMEIKILNSGVNLSTYDGYACDPSPTSCSGTDQIQNGACDERIVQILDSIEEFIRSGGCSPQVVEYDECVESSVILSSKASKSLTNACSEAINSRVSIILAELRGVVETIELEGSVLRESTITKIFDTFDQIEHFLQTDPQNSNLLCEIKQILARISGNGKTTTSEAGVSECSTAPPIECQPSSPQTTETEICERSSRRGSRLSSLKNALRKTR